jgi:hypothetical protein
MHGRDEYWIFGTFSCEIKKSWEIERKNEKNVKALRG